MPEVDTGDGNLYYEYIDLTPPWISNPPAVVLHHGVGATADIWAHWLPVLLPQFRIVRLDMRGFGRSHRPEPGYQWSFDRLARDLLAVADAAGLERFHLVGESVGGTLALYATAHHRHRVLSTCGVSCAHKGGSIDNVREWQAFIERHGMEGWSAQMMERRFRPNALPSPEFDWFAEQQAEGSQHAVVGLGEMLLDADLSNLLPNIDAPVLLLHPDGSPFIPVALSSEMHGLLPDSEMQVFAHSKHGLALTHGRDCADALVDFIARRTSESRR